MKWCSAISENPSLVLAIKDCVQQLERGMGGGRPDLAVIFVSPHYFQDFTFLAAWVNQELMPRHLIGCCGGGVIGGRLEVEERPALSITVAMLPGVQLFPFHLNFEDLSRPELAETAFRLKASTGAGSPHFLLLADPSSFEVETFLPALDTFFPGSQKIGGLAGGGMSVGMSGLFLDRQIYRRGLVGMALSGNIQVDTIVAQGCRPIGSPMFITRCDEGVLQSINDLSPFEVLEEIYLMEGDGDRAAFWQSLFLGVEMKPIEDVYDRGDFLVRNIIGCDPESGFVEVETILKPYAVVQFHLRDSETSSEDLVWHLEHYLRSNPMREPSGALLFSCLGRGQYLYGYPNHDIDLFHYHLGTIPIGGFFSNGEIGQVHGDTYLHGFTSCFGLFRPLLEE